MGDNYCTTAASFDQVGEHKDRQAVEYIFPEEGPADAVRKDEEPSVPVEEEETVRAKWRGQVEFLMTCIGYAVGLGNVWRFPYLCYKNGGGAFLIPYIIMMAMVGLPLFYLELAFGQFASLGPISIWRINPLFKGVGFAMVILSWLIALYYNVIISHTLFFFFASMTSQLPWSKCNNTWNTLNCSAYDDSHPNRNLSQLNLTGLKTPSEEYYKLHVLQQKSTINEFGTPNWALVLCLLLSWIVVLVCLIRGVQSLGKVVYFTAIFPYIMLTVLLVRGVTLDGAIDGIIFYIKPDFTRLTDAKVWSDAATQIFFSLSTGTGGLIAISSFNKFRNNCFRDAILVSAINCLTSIFAGLVIFSILGFMAFEKGLPVSKVAEEGPGLVFEVYPEALARMPVAPVWSVFFFFMMAILGFGSQVQEAWNNVSWDDIRYLYDRMHSKVQAWRIYSFSMVECVITSLLDELQMYSNNSMRNVMFRIFIISLSFILGLPMVCNGGMFLINLIDFSVSGFPLLLVALLECLAINYIYGFENFSDDIRMMIGKTPNFYWKITWKLLCPFSIIAIAIFNIVCYEEPDLDGVLYPRWAKAIGWLIVALPITVIPVWFFYKYCTQGGYYVLSYNLRPLPEWGPARKEDRVDRYSSDTLGVHKIRCLPESSRTNGLGARIQHASSLSTINSCIPNSMSGSLSSFNNAASTLTLPTTNDFTANTSIKTGIQKTESIL